MSENAMRTTKTLQKGNKQQHLHGNLEFLTMLLLRKTNLTTFLFLFRKSYSASVPPFPCFRPSSLMFCFGGCIVIVVSVAGCSVICMSCSAFPFLVRDGMEWMMGVSRFIHKVNCSAAVSKKSRIPNTRSNKRNLTF